MAVFGAAYANEYDEFVRDKNYAAECDLLESVFQRFAPGTVQSILDFGCGTGNHSIPLARRGYRMTGVDLSRDMLNAAREKAGDLKATWIEGDARAVDAGAVFDAALFMFAVLGYQVSNDDIFGTLKNARRHVRTDGLLIFDVWYGPAVLKIRPSDRLKIVSLDDCRIIRATSSELDVRHHTCTVQHHLFKLVGNRLVNESKESHVVRYFFPKELEFLLSQTGFGLASLTAFPTIDQPCDETTWNVLGVARAV